MKTEELYHKILEAKERLQNVVVRTPLVSNFALSELTKAKVFLKREDLQSVRSYKIRGAYNTIAQLTEVQRQSGIVCASAGNHAQGVALACSTLLIKGVIFMPVTTPKQKIKKVSSFGGDFIEIVLKGDAYDDAYDAAMEYRNEKNAVFIHPFDDFNVIAGQGTIGLEILEDANFKPDYVFVPVGGGGLAAGLSTVFRKLSPETKIVGVEPKGAASMKAALEAGEVISLNKIDKFVDGAAVKRVGMKNFALCIENLHKIIEVPEGKVCSAILKLYNEEAMVVEPAGALAIAALDLFDEDLSGKNVVCIVSGSNNDITRTEEIRERSLIYEGLKHYFLIEFPQRPGALKEFVTEVLGPNDDITYFQFAKKNNRENGPAVVGLELGTKEDLLPIRQSLVEKRVNYTYLNDNQLLFSQLIG